MPATLKEFESVFPQLVKDVEAHCEKYKLPDQALTWFSKVMTIPPLAICVDHRPVNFLLTDAQSP
jgi:farnesyl diphosphate synthase